MGKLNNYKGTVKISSGLACKSGYDYPLAEAHSILIGENDARLDQKIQEIDNFISNGGNITVNGLNISNLRGHNTGFSYELLIEHSADNIMGEGHFFMLYGYGLPTGTSHGLLDVDYYNGVGFTPSGNPSLNEFVVKQTFRPWDTNVIYFRTYRAVGSYWTVWEKIDFKAIEMEKAIINEIVAESYDRERDGTAVSVGVKPVQSGNSLRFDIAAEVSIPSHHIPIMEPSKLSITVTSDYVSGTIGVLDAQYVYDETNNKITVRAQVNKNYTVKVVINYKYKFATLT